MEITYRPIKVCECHEQADQKDKSDRETSGAVFLLDISELKCLTEQFSVVGSWGGDSGALGSCAGICYIFYPSINGAQYTCRKSERERERKRCVLTRWVSGFEEQGEGK